MMKDKEKRIIVYCTRLYLGYKSVQSIKKNIKSRNVPLSNAPLVFKKVNPSAFARLRIVKKKRKVLRLVKSKIQREEE